MLVKASNGSFVVVLLIEVVVLELWHIVSSTFSQSVFLAITRAASGSLLIVASVCCLQAHCMQQFLDDHLNVLRPVAEGQYVDFRVVNSALQYIMHAIELKEPYKLVKPHLDPLMYGVVWRLMRFNDEDAELWEEDPQEYVRKVCTCMLGGAALIACCSQVYSIILLACVASETCLGLVIHHTSVHAPGNRVAHN